MQRMMVRYVADDGKFGTPLAHPSRGKASIAPLKSKDVCLVSVNTVS